MPNPYFKFKQFTIWHDRCAMKVTTDSCLFGAWVAQALHGTASGSRLLDIGTGTGLLSLMIAQQHSFFIDAVELDGDAATQASANMAASPWAGCIRVHQQNILNFSVTAPWDVIVSNPPFYENELSAASRAKNIAHHSQELKLAALVEFIGRHLTSTGKCFLLLPFKRLTEASHLLQQQGLYLQQKWAVQQSVLHPPFRVMLQAGRQPMHVQERDLAIWDEAQNYTAGFTALLKDYYLYL